VHLTATPASGWVFTGWSGDASGSDSVISVVMDGEKSVTATFCLGVTLNVMPQLIILKDFRWWKWVAAYVTPPAPYPAADIDATSLRMNGVPALTNPAPKILWHGRTLRVIFNRHDFIATLVPGNHVPVTLTGAIGSSCLTGVDYVRVWGPKVHKPCGGDQLIAGSLADITWDVDPDARAVTVMSSTDDGTTWNIEAQNAPNTGTFEWTVPSVVSDVARVQVISIYDQDPDGTVNQAEYALSDAFSIATPTAVGDAPVIFALSPIHPNPATRNALTVNFSLPSDAVATLELLDVTGRRVTVREVGSLGVGQHTVNLIEGRRLAPGLYLIRLTQGVMNETERVVVIE
jgi:uncharacterized repeat protein (TIGR02543 family)